MLHYIDMQYYMPVEIYIWLCFMTVCTYRDIHTLQPYIIDFTQWGCHTLRV